ncbi:hypothetical protein G6556_15820, partial [Cellulomonas sp. IC4_254]|nr:hypothetical protein [Cellulomonas sp. IC4_254]
MDSNDLLNLLLVGVPALAILGGGAAVIQRRRSAGDRDRTDERPAGGTGTST